MDTSRLAELRKLSLAERIQLVQDLWDSIAEDADSLELSDTQRAELDRRLAEAEQNPGAGRPWADVRERLLEGE